MRKLNLFQKFDFANWQKGKNLWYKEQNTMRKKVVSVWM